MTSTLTRPPEAPAGAATAEPSRTPPDNWLTTGDHKRVGLMFILGGLAAVIAACASALIFQLPSGPDLHVWTMPASRLTSIAASVALVVGIPALWIGIATYVVPLQIGATRLALPRLHNLSLWTYFTGGVLLTIGYLADHAPINSLASSAPAAAPRGRSADDVTELIIAGLFLVVLGIVFAAIGLLTTLLNRRTDGMRLTFLPLFSWSTLATASVLVLAGPVLLAGLILLFYDHHYGGTVFATGDAGRRIWEHQLWLLGHPLGLVFAASGVGIFGDVVATATRRPLAGFSVARAAAVAAPLLTLLLWAGDLSVLESPFGPVATGGGIAVGLPLGLAVLTWLGTLKASKPRFGAALLFVVSFLIVVLLATALSLAAVAAGVEGADAEAFRNGQITLLMFGAPLLALVGATVHWSSKLRGRATGAGAAGLQCLLLLVGVLLMAAPGYAVGLGADPTLGPVGAAGSAAVIAGLLLAATNAVRARSDGAVAANDDDRGGLTLEWATASPPPVHNFDRIPEVRSAYPLAEPEEAVR